MYANVINAGEVDHGYKPQYSITNQVFTCPECKEEISSKCYIKQYFWRKAVIDHMWEKHNQKVEDEHA